jgi:protein-disulfide isomerase
MQLTRRIFLGVSLALAMLAVFAAPRTGAAAGTPAVLPDMTLGAPDAPLTIIEYASMTCGHCRHFAETTFPELKKNYIDTGKVHFIFREFPLDGLALRASMLARCAGSDANSPDAYFKVVDLLFKQQHIWARSQDPVAALSRVAKLTGVKQSTFEACMANRALAGQIVAVRQAGVDKYAVNATPTLIINGETYRGDREFPVFDKFLKNKLGEH